MRIIIYSKFKSIYIGLFFGLIGCVTTLIAGGFFSVPFGSPLALHSDALFLLLISKSFLSGFDLTKIQFLGWPNGVNFSNFPLFDFTQFEIIRLLNGQLKDVFKVWSGYHITIVSLNFLACYLLFLSITGSPLQATIMAFGCQFFAYVGRAGYHNFLFATYSVYLSCYVILELFAKESIYLSKVNWISFVQRYVLNIFCLFIIALSGIYYLFFYLLIVSFIAIYQFLREIKFDIRKTILSIAFPVFIFFIVTIYNYPHIFFDPYINLPGRSAMDQSGEALRIADIYLEFGSNKYNLHYPFGSSGFVKRFANERVGSEAFDAFSGPIVSIIVILAPFFALLSFGGIINRWFQFDKNWTKVLFLSSLIILFIILFATPFGYGMIFNQIFTGTFRSQNRFSVFMNIFGAILLFGLIKYIFRNKPKIFIFVLIFIIGFNGIPRYGYWYYLQKPLIENSSDYVKSANSINSKIEPSNKSIVLQLPISSFPEAPKIGNFDTYDHLYLPILFPNSDPDYLPRWSFGEKWLVPGFEIKRKLIGHPLMEKWSSNAACLGFNYIVIEKRAYDSTALPSPDQNRWTLAYDDEVRQLWQLKDSIKQFENCSLDYVLDYGNVDDHRLFKGEGRFWKFTDSGAFIKNNSAELVIPLIGSFEQISCLTFDFVFVRQSKLFLEPLPIYFYSGIQNFTGNVSNETEAISFEMKATQQAWNDRMLVLSLSFLPENSTLSEKIFMLWKYRDIRLGVKSVHVQSSCVKTSK